MNFQLNNKIRKQDDAHDGMAYKCRQSKSMREYKQKQKQQYYVMNCTRKTNNIIVSRKKLEKAFE